MLDRRGDVVHRNRLQARGGTKVKQYPSCTKIEREGLHSEGKYLPYVIHESVRNSLGCPRFQRHPQLGKGVHLPVIEVCNVSYEMKWEYSENIAEEHTNDQL